MAASFWSVESGLSIFNQEGIDKAKVTFLEVDPRQGAGISADVNTLGLRDNGEIYIKTGPSDTDWSKQATETFVNDAVAAAVSADRWRPELVVAATGDAAPAEGTAVSTLLPFSDDNGPSIATPVDGDYIIFGVGGTAKLGKVFDDAGTDKVTFVGFEAIATGDAFIVNAYLPDTDGQENAVGLLAISATDVVKIFDFDFAAANAINLSPSYSPSSGNPVPNDSVEKAISNIDGNVDQLTSAVGVSQGDSNLGTWTGAGSQDILTDNAESAKSSIQKVANEIGAAVTGLESRTKGQLSDQAVNLNLEQIDDVIGPDSDLTPETRAASQLAVNQSIYKNIDLLDKEIGPDSAITSEEHIAVSNTINANLNALDAGIFGIIEKDTLTGQGIATGVILATVPKADHDAVKFLIKAKSGTNYHASEVLAVHNGSSVDYNDVGRVKLGTTVLKNIAVIINGADLELKADVELASTDAVITKIKL